MTKAVITIAASDSIGGAGIQADLRVFRDLGVYGTCAVTNITAQNTLGVHKVNKVPPTIIAAQIDACARDLNLAACKIGMLYSHQAVDTVAERIERRSIPNVVLDTPIAAKGGELLLSKSAIKRLKWKLLSKSTLITPNVPEAEILTDLVITDRIKAEDAAKKLVDMGCANVLIKGGHFSGDAVDLLYDGTDFIEYPAKRLDKNMHGTGCVLSSAIAAYFALGKDLPAAVAAAKEYVTNAINCSQRLGKGKMDLFI